MRIIAPVLASAAVLAACAPPSESASFSPSGALNAELLVGTSNVHVGLSDQAHVALFAVTPGRGVQLVYPRPQERAAFPAGWAPLRPGPDGGPRVALASQLGSEVLYGRNTMLVLIAARDPLPVRYYAQSNVALERDLGAEAYLAHDTDAVVERLRQVVIGDRPSGDWAMDAELAPQGREPARVVQDRYVRVNCGSSYVLAPLERSESACRWHPAPDTTAGRRAGVSASRSPARSVEPAPGESRRARVPARRVESAESEAARAATPSRAADRRDAEPVNVSAPEPRARPERTERTERDGEP